MEAHGSFKYGTVALATLAAPLLCAKSPILELLKLAECLHCGILTHTDWLTKHHRLSPTLTLSSYLTHNCEPPSPHLSTSLHISPHLSTSLHISPHLSTSLHHGTWTSASQPLVADALISSKNFEELKFHLPAVIPCHAGYLLGISSYLKLSPA